MALQQLRFQKILKELQQNQENDFCFCCAVKAPTHLLCRFNIFVCQLCSTQCRKFSWRVKSVTLSNFSEDEINRVKAGGNKVARELYLAGWTPEKLPLPTPGDEQSILRFLEHTFSSQTFKGIPSGSTHKDLEAQPTPCSPGLWTISNSFASLSTLPSPGPQSPPHAIGSSQKHIFENQAKENNQTEPMDLEPGAKKSSFYCHGVSKKQSPLAKRIRKPPQDWWNAQSRASVGATKRNSDGPPNILKQIFKTTSPFKLKKFELGHIFKPLQRFARPHKSPMNSPFKRKATNEVFGTPQQTPEKQFAASPLVKLACQSQNTPDTKTPTRPIIDHQEEMSSAMDVECDTKTQHSIRPWESPLAPKTTIDHQYYLRTPIKFNFNTYAWGEAVVLPEETLRSIFAFLNSSRDLCSLACVSSRWRAIADGEQLWKPLFKFHWGAAVSKEADTWKESFFSRKSTVLMQQIKSGKSYANKRKRQELSSQMTRSNSGLTFKRVAPVDNGPKKKAISKTLDQPNEELVAFFQQKSAYFDQFSEMELPTTPQK